jgi:hypothetical protein
MMFQNPASASRLLPFSITQLRSSRLRAGARHEAANLRCAVRVVIWPHDGRTKNGLARLQPRRQARQPIAHQFVHDSAHPGASQSTSCTLTPSANEQHKPFPLARRSNHGLSGELANRPSSRASNWFGASIIKQNAKTGRSLSLHIVASIDGCRVSNWQASDVPKWPPVERWPLGQIAANSQAM